MNNCKHLGCHIESNLCSCGATIEIRHCNRQQMECVSSQIDFERELDRRHSIPAEKVTVKELKRILAVCEGCPIRE